MKKFEELLDKRNQEIDLEKEAYEKEKARERADGINYGESVALGLLYGFIGAIAGMVVIGLALWVVLAIILSIAGSKMDGDSILELSAWIGLIIGALGGYAAGFYSRRD